MKRVPQEEVKCSIARSLAEVGGLWSLLIVRDVFMGKRRFSELAESMGVARSILSARLKDLVAHGVLELRPVSDDARYQEYEVTPKGRDLIVTLVALEQWGSRWASPGGKAAYMRIERATGQEIAPMAVHSADGRVLAAEELAVVRRPEVEDALG